MWGAGRMRRRPSSESRAIALARRRPHRHRRPWGRLLRLRRLGADGRGSRWSAGHGHDSKPVVPAAHHGTPVPSLSIHPAQRTRQFVKPLRFDLAHVFLEASNGHIPANQQDTRYNRHAVNQERQKDLVTKTATHPGNLIRGPIRFIQNRASHLGTLIKSPIQPSKSIVLGPPNETSTINPSRLHNSSNIAP